MSYEFKPKYKSDYNKLETNNISKEKKGFSDIPIRCNYTVDSFNQDYHQEYRSLSDRKRNDA